MRILKTQELAPKALSSDSEAYGGIGIFEQVLLWSKETSPAKTDSPGRATPYKCALQAVLEQFTYWY